MNLDPPFLLQLKEMLNDFFPTALSELVIHYRATVTMRPYLTYKAPYPNFHTDLFRVSVISVNVSSGNSIWRMPDRDWLVHEGIILGWCYEPPKHEMNDDIKHSFSFAKYQGQWRIKFSGDKHVTQIHFKVRVANVYTWDVNEKRQILSVVGDNKLYLFWFDEVMRREDVEPFWNQTLHQSSYGRYDVAFDGDRLVFCTSMFAQLDLKKAIQIWEFVVV